MWSSQPWLFWTFVITQMSRKDQIFGAKFSGTKCSTYQKAQQFWVWWLSLLWIFIFFYENWGKSLKIHSSLNSYWKLVPCILCYMQKKYILIINLKVAYFWTQAFHQFLGNFIVSALYVVLALSKKFDKNHPKFSSFKIQRKVFALF